MIEGISGDIRNKAKTGQLGSGIRKSNINGQRPGSSRNWPIRQAAPGQDFGAMIRSKQRNNGKCAINGQDNNQHATEHTQAI
jgi:hypothetical protein